MDFSDFRDALNVFVKSVKSKRKPKKQTDEEICKDLSNLYQGALKLRKPLEVAMKRNLWYFENRMNYDYNLTTSSFENVFKKKYSMKEYVPVNLMFRIFETKLGILNTMPLDYVVDAGSSELEDDISAKISERLLNGKIKQDVSNKLYTLLFSCLWENRTLVKVFWDKSIGGVVSFPEIVYDAGLGNMPIYQKDPKTGQVVVDNSGIPSLELTTDGKPKYIKVVEGIPQFNVFREGDVRISILSPFEYVVDPTARGDNVFNPEIAEHPARWVCQSDMVTRQFIENNFNLSEKELEKIKWTKRIFQDGIEQEINQMRGVSIEADGVESVQYYEHWELPSDDYPDGRLVSYLDGNLILQNKPLPKEFLSINRLPFTDLCDIVIPWRYWGKTNLELIAPLQQAYTKDVSHFQYLLSEQGKKLMAVQGSGSRIKMIDVPKELADKGVAYDGSQQMQISQYDGFSMSLLKALEQWLRDIEMVSGVSDLKYPIRTQTATEILKVVEQDASRMGRFKKSLVNCLTDIGYLALMVMKENYLDGRKIKILGDYDKTEIITFNKNNISKGFNVNIQSAGLYYGSRIGRLNMIKEVAGLIPLIQDPDKIREYGKIISKTIDELLEIKYHTQSNNILDVKQSQRENLILINNVNKNLEVPQEWNAISVTDFQNHGVHIEEHENFLKRYDNKLNSVQTSFLIQHIEAHKGKQTAQLVHLMQVRQAMATPLVEEPKQEVAQGNSSFNPPQPDEAV